MKILHNHPLSSRCTLGVGGNAQQFVQATTLIDVEQALQHCEHEGLSLTVLGGGSNVVIADGGVCGLVLSIALRGKRAFRMGNRARVHVGAGEPWDDFVDHCVSQNWAGIECLSGIPGTVGATPIQNVGAYGQEVSSTIVNVLAYDRSDSRVVTLSNAECQFAYRSSIFKTRDLGRHIVLEVEYEFPVGGAPSIKYAELSKALASQASPTLHQVRDTVIALRRQKSMVLDANDPNGRSCGSFFLNPVVTSEQLQHIRAVSPAASPPSFPQTDGSFKVPAAWLIEQSGFVKGLERGPVGLSTRHALAIVAHSGATARDVVALAHEIQDGVLAHFGVRLHPEPIFLGFEKLEHGLPTLP
ncbi:MAG TPA: UDP-N-acetylmuramate dehydrogenase [Polyangiaceae bacterium]|nr:UDP-N-acetylmuramate dehydrogenase [Polyangiaceae bacterium]